MLWDEVCEFVAITEAGGKASDPRQRRLMITMRRAGLTSTQIVALSGGRLSDSLVRQYTSGWGKVKRSLARQMDALMGPLRQLVLSRVNIGDVEEYVKVKASVEAKGSSMEELTDFWGYLRGDVLPGDVGGALGFYREAKDDGLTPAVISVWKKRDDELTDSGFNRKTRRLLLEASEMCGGVENSFGKLLEYIQLEDGRAATRKVVEEAEAAKRRRVEEEVLYNQFKVSREGHTTLLLAGWSPLTLVLVPEVLKQADTPAKQVALINLFKKYEYAEGDKVLVKKSKAASVDPRVLAQTFEELRTRVTVAPLISEQVIDLTTTLIERLPGVTIGDYASYLLNVTNSSDQEKVLAKELVGLEEDAGKSIHEIDSEETGTNALMLLIQRNALRMSAEEQRRRYATEEQREAYDKAVAMGAGALPPGADLRGYWGIMRNMMHTLVEASAKDETLSYEEKKVAAGLGKYVDLFQNVRGEGPTRSRAPDLIPKILAALLDFEQPTYAHVIEVSEKLDADEAMVEACLDYLVSDPTSRTELRRIGYSKQIPGWVATQPNRISG